MKQRTDTIAATVSMATISFNIPFGTEGKRMQMGTYRNNKTRTEKGGADYE